MKSRVVLLISLLFSVHIVLSQNFNRPVPSLFPKYQFSIVDSTFEGEYLLTPMVRNVTNDTTENPLIILDDQGYIVWYHRNSGKRALAFDYFESQNKFGFITLSNFNDFERAILDTSFTKLDSVTNSFGYSPDTHEFQILENGNYLVVDKKDSVMDLSSFVFVGGITGSATTNCVGFVIREIDTLHNIVFEWNSNDYMHPTECVDSTYGYSPIKFDYAHGNSVDEDDDGNFIVSFRHTNSIVKINRLTGQIIWRLGGKLSDFTLINDTHGFSGQHDVRRVDNGNITLFDNMNSKTPAPIRSRVLELSLDETNMTATKEWFYRYLPGFQASGMGSYQKTIDGFHLISYGFSHRPNPSVHLVNSMNEDVSTIFFQDSTITYRARTYNLPITFPRPNITCTRVGSDLILTSELSECYEWSTGDTIRSIIVSDTGDYQVWVNHGIGMVGSNPYRISNVQLHCTTTGIRVDENAIIGSVSAVYDILGRPEKYPKLGTLYVVKFLNGYSKLVFWNEDYNKSFKH